MRAEELTVLNRNFWKLIKNKKNLLNVLKEKLKTNQEIDTKIKH